MSKLAESLEHLHTAGDELVRALTAGALYRRICFADNSLDALEQYRKCDAEIHRCKARYAKAAERFQNG